MPRPQPSNYLAGTSGDDTLDSSGSTEDWTINGFAGNDAITGGSGHDSLLGGRGDDLINGSAVDLLIDGGAGIDTLSFTASGSGVRVDLASGGMAAVGTPLQPERVARIENIIGSSFNDILVGNRSANELDGGGGNDHLHPVGSGDFLTGGSGADEFFIFGASRTVTITDFHFNEGDRLQVEGPTPSIDWVDGFAPDADGNLQQAWIAICDRLSGADLQVIVLGADTAPSSAWFI